MAESKKDEELIVQGNPVVSVGDEKFQLEGGATLSAEYRKKLGESKIANLRRTGFLKTQEEIDAEDAQRQAANERRGADDVNPNYGTPAMTEEAQAAAAAAAAPATQAKGKSALAARPVTDLDVSAATLEALQAAGFKTVGDVLKFGKENERLAGKVENIGEAREAEVKDAIGKLSKS